MSFLNVDLEIGASTRAVLAPLIATFDGTLFELYRGRMRGLYRAHYEISGCGFDDATKTIHALADAIEALRGPARRAWNAAKVRDFNVGVELERGVKAFELAIDARAVKRVAALGGRIAFTAYQAAAMQSAAALKR